MSKAALQKIVDEITATTSKTIRETHLNRQVHIFSINENAVAQEMLSEIQIRDELALKKDPNYRSLAGQVSPQVISQAARDFTRFLTTESTIAPFFDRSTSTFRVDKGAGTYRLISGELTIANKRAIDFIEKSGAPVTTLKASEFIQFDHVHASANVRTAYALSKSREGGAILNKLLTEHRITKEDYEVYTEVLSYYQAEERILEFNTQVISGSLESGATNVARGNTVELSRRGAIIRALNKLILSKNLEGLKSSDSYLDFIEKRINNAAVRSGADGKIVPFQTAANKAAKKSTVTLKSTTSRLPQMTRDRVPVVVRNIKPRLNLKDLINARLKGQVISNMGPDTLVNRTGTLASSARIVSQDLTRQGYESLAYTYQRSPYDVFDPILGKKPWNTPGRNPRALIEKSIREIVAEYTKERFYMRRV